jgi:hypothetical protein
VGTDLKGATGFLFTMATSVFGLLGFENRVTGGSVRESPPPWTGFRHPGLRTSRS